MQQKSNNESIRARITMSILLLTLIGTSLVSYKTNKLGDEIWSQLGLTKQDGNTGITNSFLQGYLYYYGARNAKNIATGNRASVVKELGAYAKQFVNTDAFKKEYLLLRESRKPVAPPVAKTLEQIRAEQKATYQKSIKDMEPLLKSDNADLKKMSRESIDFMQKQIKDAEDPNNEIMKMMADGEKTNFEMKTKEFKTNMDKWEKEYPADQTVLVKFRLAQFLTITADVDFNAELKEQYGKKRFVNPLYEKKRPEWKQAFRAGKDATETARAFAQAWLKELN